MSELLASSPRSLPLDPSKRGAPASGVIAVHRALARTRAVEVAAMLGDTVVSVKHCVDPRAGRGARATWGITVAGVACLLAATVAFALALHNAADTRRRFERWTVVEHKPAWAFRPARLWAGIEWLTFGGLALGVAGVAVGAARLRRERPSPYYRIGTAPGVELAIEGAPGPAFPLVAPVGDGFVLNYGAGIDGELVVDGETTPFAQLAAGGRVRPSAATAGAVELPIPADARIRARIGRTTIVVSAVAPPRQHPASLLARNDRRTLAYVVGSLVVHAVVLGVLRMIPPDEIGINAERSPLEDMRFVTNNVSFEEPPPDEPRVTSGNGDSQGASVAMALPTGKAGAPDNINEGRRQVARTTHEPAQMSRDDELRDVLRGGILGSYRLQHGFQSASAIDYTSGFDSVSIDGAPDGSDGGGRGNFGSGIRGFGPGGGGIDDHGPSGCCARYATIGRGRSAGDDYGIPTSGGPGLPPHRAAVPRIREPTISGASYDKSIVRRYIRQHLNEIAYCYDKQLLAKPGLGGEITLRFFIAPTGAVQGASGTGFDAEVARCLAEVISNIGFPAPGEGGVQVSYPFQFRTAGT